MVTREAREALAETVVTFIPSSGAEEVKLVFERETVSVVRHDGTVKELSVSNTLPPPKGETFEIVAFALITPVCGRPTLELMFQRMLTVKGKPFTGTLQEDTTWRTHFRNAIRSEPPRNGAPEPPAFSVMPSTIPKFANRLWHMPTPPPFGLRGLRFHTLSKPGPEGTWSWYAPIDPSIGPHQVGTPPLSEAELWTLLECEP